MSDPYQIEGTKNFIMMIGPPRCGKTTYVDEFIKTHPDWTRINSDDIRIEITGSRGNMSQDKKVFKEVHSRIDKALNNDENVIYDATNCNRFGRAKILRTAMKCHPSFICGMVSLKPLYQILRINDNADIHVPEHIIERMYTNLRDKPPVISEGFDMLRRF